LLENRRYTLICYSLKAVYVSGAASQRLLFNYILLKSGAKRCTYKILQDSAVRGWVFGTFWEMKEKLASCSKQCGPVQTLQNAEKGLKTEGEILFAICLVYLVVFFMFSVSLMEDFCSILLLRFLSFFKIHLHIHICILYSIHVSHVQEGD